MDVEEPQDLDRLIEETSALVERAAANLDFEPWQADAARAAGFAGAAAERTTVSGVFEPRPPCDRC